MLNVKKLNELMIEKHISSYRDLASKAGLSYTTLIYMINGHDMYVSNLIKLSKFFEIMMDDLICTGYNFVVLDDKKTKYTGSKNIYEVTLKNMV